MPSPAIQHNISGQHIFVLHQLATAAILAGPDSQDSESLAPATSGRQLNRLPLGQADQRSPDRRQNRYPTHDGVSLNRLNELHQPFLTGFFVAIFHKTAHSNPLA